MELISRVAVVVLLLSTVMALAAPRTPPRHAFKQVTFRNWPGGADVVWVRPEGRKLLGQSNTPLTLDVGDFRVASSDIVLEFRLAGYHPETMKMPRAWFDREVTFPNEDGPPVRLQATVPVVLDAWHLMREHPRISIALGVALITVPIGIVLAVMAWKRRQRALLLAADVTENRLGRDDPMSGRLIGPYEIHSRLGSGGMGVVFKAEKDGQTVALKVLHPEFSQDPEYRRRFQHEVEAGRRFTHPGLVKVLDSGEVSGRLFCAFEIVEGETLQQQLKSGPMSWEETRTLMLSLMEAVDAAHCEGVVHRDLKPSNIMLTGPGRLKVMDFGIACGREFTRLTESGVLVGTPVVMAPEHLRGERVDGRADQYSIGVVAWWMLTGRAPFHDESTVRIIEQKMEGTPIPPLPFDGYPRSMRAIIERMTHPDAAQRYADLMECAAAWRGL